MGSSLVVKELLTLLVHLSSLPVCYGFVTSGKGTTYLLVHLSSLTVCYGFVTSGKGTTYPSGSP